MASAVGDKGTRGVMGVGWAQAAHLQPPGFGPAPLLTVDALVTLLDKQHPSVPGIHTVCVRNGGLLEQMTTVGLLGGTWPLSPVSSEVVFSLSPTHGGEEPRLQEGSRAGALGSIFLLFLECHHP